MCTFDGRKKRGRAKKHRKIRSKLEYLIAYVAVSGFKSTFIKTSYSDLQYILKYRIQFDSQTMFFELILNNPILRQKTGMKREEIEVSSEKEKNKISTEQNFTLLRFNNLTSLSKQSKINLVLVISHIIFDTNVMLFLSPLFWSPLQI